jgi:hypothetical protein
MERQIPWDCERLVIAIGFAARLPVMDEVKAEARQLGVELVMCLTPEAVQVLKHKPDATNAILPVPVASGPPSWPTSRNSGGRADCGVESESGDAGLEPASPDSSSTNQYLSSRPKFNP